MRNKTKARIGMGTAVMLVRHPRLRRATTRVAAPTAKVLIRRQLRDRAGQVGAVATSAGTAVVIYGPIAAELLGLVEPPKRKRRAPMLVVAVAVAVTAAACYALARSRS